MDPSYQVRLIGQIDLRNAMVIVGCPGEGLVGATAARHIISILDMKLIGTIRAAHHVPRSIVRGGRAGHPIQIYAVGGFNARHLRAERLIVINVEQLPVEGDWQPLANEIVRWADSLEVQVIVSPGGVTVEDEQLDDKVWGAATSDFGLKLLDDLGVERFEGTVGGLAAGLLHACEDLGPEGICLLAEAAPEYPDAHAAARIVKLLDRLTPAFAIPETPLVEEAKRHEREIRATLEMLEKRGAHTGQKRGRT